MWNLLIYTSDITYNYKKNKTKKPPIYIIIMKTYQGALNICVMKNPRIYYIFQTNMKWILKQDMVEIRSKSIYNGYMLQRVITKIKTMKDEQ